MRRLRIDTAVDNRIGSFCADAPISRYLRRRFRPDSRGRGERRKEGKARSKRRGNKVMGCETKRIIYFSRRKGYPVVPWVIVFLFYVDFTMYDFRARYLAGNPPERWEMNFSDCTFAAANDSVSEKNTDVFVVSVHLYIQIFITEMIPDLRNYHFYQSERKKNLPITFAERFIFLFRISVRVPTKRSEPSRVPPSPPPPPLYSNSCRD